MTLQMHRAARTDVLAARLGDLMATPLDDPFAAELVVVPAKGVERWLSQRLAHRLGVGSRGGDGVCAGVTFRSPWSLFAAITGTDDEDPWAPDALVWPLLAAIDGHLDQPWARPLARHLGHGLEGEEADLRRGRRFATARRLAGLFASYAVQRPSLVADWAAGGASDGCGRALPHDLAWQPPLWRALAERVAGPAPHLRHAETLERLRADPAAYDLPARVSLFGHTRVPVTEAELLAALGAHRDVHLWLPHPSAALWSALDGALRGEGRTGPVSRRADRSHRLVAHPLLSTLGRDTRELQRTLAAVMPVDVPVDVDSTGADRRHPDGGGRDTLLGWLQRDLHANAAPDPAVRASRRLAPDDRSVQVHACHGPARQVEVLREVLLGLLADDPTLEPRDVLVMCPDIEAYAPLVQAGFGLGDVVGDDGHPAHRLRVRLADRALTQTNPLLAVASRLLDLAGGRAGAGEVLDLAHAEPVRRRFGFRDADLQQLTEWVRAAGIRWAFDADHRAEYGLEAYVANTWQFGLDRLLAGVAMSEDARTWLDRTLPVDDVGSGQADLVGRLAEYVDRLRDVTDRLVGTRPLEHWLGVLEEGVAALTSVPPSEGWQTGQVQRELGRLRDAATRDGADLASTPLRLPDVRALLADRLAGRPTRANFRTGTLTVATLVPMRSVPHRVVCLLGLDDGVFPRTGSLDGDDVLGREPLTGERDPRSEDRQLLLDAILAATETLVVTYTGANEFSGQEQPPAVPLGELLDALDVTAIAPAATAATATAAAPAEGPGSVAAAVTTRHPLQPFDRRNVTPGALVAGAPFSFDPAALAGARAAAGTRSARPPFLTGPLPAPAAAADVSVDDLLEFFTRKGGPAQGFLSRQRLDLALPREQEAVDDGLPVEVDQLVQWEVGDRLVRDLLDGVPPDVAQQQEWRRGVLPPGQLGWRILRQLLERAGPLAAEARRLRTRSPGVVEIDVDLGGGRRLRGSVAEVYGDRLVPVSYSRLGAPQRLQSWIRLLALTATDDDHSWSAHTIGRPANSRARDPFAVSLLGPLDHRAADTLRHLVAVRDRGLCAPLPLPVKASLSYARVRRTMATHDEAIRKAGWDWYDGRYPGEQSHPAHVRVWGPGAPLPGLGEQPGSGEEHDGETTRFGALAMGLWSPVLVAEQGSW